MQYTELSPEIKADYIKNTKWDRAPSLSTAKLNTGYFARNFLGVTPYSWQYAFWNKLDTKNTRVIVTTPRQVGKSLACAIFALKAAILNTHPAGVSGKTYIGIVSATDEQSMKLMGEIKNLIRLGDEYISTSTGGKTKGYFSNQIDNSVEAENNKTTITFKNGNIIRCLPPTDRVRGYSFSYVFVDEAAFIEDEDIFFGCIKPTVSKTNGYIVITSTPNGQQGFFYEIFDPEDKLSEHEFERIWLNWRMIDDDKYRSEIEKAMSFYYNTGRDREFRQEYEAEFTSQVSAFFESKDVDSGIDNDLVRETESKDATHMGIDFGMVNSNTVISISRKDKDTIKLVWQYIYGPGKDTDLVKDIKVLVRDYSVEKIIVDDCPQGDYIIKELTKDGMPLTLMKFRTEKVSKYTSFRSMLRKGRVKYYPAEELIKQMKSLQEIATPTTTKIEKPSGGKDDCTDSFLMSCYHFLGDFIEFESFIVKSADKKNMEAELMEELSIWEGNNEKANS